MLLFVLFVVFPPPAPNLGDDGTTLVTWNESRASRANGGRQRGDVEGARDVVDLTER
jgi:hypothetical protein